MIERIKALFSEPKPADDTRREIGELELAATALLVEAARMDGRFDEEERRVVARLVGLRFDLEPAAALDLIDAADRTIDESNDLWGFARVVKNRFSPEDRIELMEMLWEVAYADGDLHEYEANLLRRIGGLIYVSDRDRGAARKRVLDRRARR